MQKGIQRSTLKLPRCCLRLVNCTNQRDMYLLLELKQNDVISGLKKSLIKIKIVL